MAQGYYKGFNKGYSEALRDIRVREYGVEVF